MPRTPKKYQGYSDDVSSIAARERFEAAMSSVGPFLNGILRHVGRARPTRGRVGTHEWPRQEPWGGGAIHGP
jgi:hypothetical protein